MAIKLHFQSGYRRQVYILVALLSSFVYGYLAYFSERSEFFSLISLYGLAFLSTYLVIEKSSFNFKQLLWLSIIYKLIFIAAIPSLSQDFFRFFWDGQLVIQGVKPYLENVDSYFIKDSPFIIHQAEILRDGMGSLNASNYSNYPPFSQLLYAISAMVAQDSIPIFVIALRILLLGFDLIFIYFAHKILCHFNKNPKALFWYALNPLCILEITGNLHLEGVMIALFVAGVYFLISKKYAFSGLLISLSVGTKLLSLIALPLVFVFLWRTFKSVEKYKNLVIFGLSFSLVLAFQFLPFLSTEFINNFSDTIGLWFGKFEFNASVFYLVRWFGFQVYGYNIIQTYGWVMPIIAIMAFSIILFRQKRTERKVMAKFLWMLTIYFLLSTTVHPWYILFPLALSVFTRFKFALVWSFVVFLSYYAYTDSQVTESMLLISFEYGLLILAIAYDFFGKRLNATLKIF